MKHESERVKLIGNMPTWTPEEYEAHQRRQIATAGKSALRPCEDKPIVKVAMSLTTDEAKLNKTEAAYLAYIRRMDYKWIGIQNITLKLANDCRLTPDFATIDSAGNLRLIDVKGFQREDALIKMKVAARMFPWIEFVIVKKDGASWSHEYVKP